MSATEFTVGKDYIATNLPDDSEYYLDNSGHAGIEIYVDIIPPTALSQGFIIQPGDYRRYTLRATETLYVKAVGEEEVSSLLATRVASTSIERVTEVSDRGNIALAVYIQDQTTEPLDVPFLQSRVFSSVAVQPAIDDRTIELTPAHGAMIGDMLEIADTITNRFMQSRVIAVATNLVTIDAPINFSYPIGSNVAASQDDLRVDGSVTPQIFSLLPLPGQAGDMVRIIIEMRSTLGIDYSGWGGDGPLTNGCVLRVRRGDGNFRNLANWKTNGDIIFNGYENNIQTKTGGGEHAIVIKSTYGGQSRRGVVIRLEGTLGEELQIVIQDDLTVGGTTKNVLFRAVAQGHELQMD